MFKNRTLPKMLPRTTNFVPHYILIKLYLYYIYACSDVIKVFDRNRLIYKTIELYYFQCKKSIKLSKNM